MVNKYFTYVAARRLNLSKLPTRDKSIFSSARLQAYESKILKDSGEPFMKNDLDQSYDLNDDDVSNDLPTTEIVDRFLTHHEKMASGQREGILQVSKIVLDAPKPSSTSFTVFQSICGLPLGSLVFG